MAVKGIPTLLALLLLQFAIKQFAPHAVNSLNQNSHARGRKYMQDVGCNIEQILTVDFMVHLLMIRLLRFFKSRCEPLILKFVKHIPD